MLKYIAFCLLSMFCVSITSHAPHDIKRLARQKRADYIEVYFSTTFAKAKTKSRSNEDKLAGAETKSLLKFLVKSIKPFQDIKRRKRQLVFSSNRTWSFIFPTNSPFSVLFPTRGKINPSTTTLPTTTPTTTTKPTTQTTTYLTSTAATKTKMSTAKPVTKTTKQINAATTSHVHTTSFVNDVTTNHLSSVTKRNKGLKSYYFIGVIAGLSVFLLICFLIIGKCYRDNKKKKIGVDPPMYTQHVTAGQQQETVKPCYEVPLPGNQQHEYEYITENGSKLEPVTYASTVSPANPINHSVSYISIDP